MSHTFCWYWICFFSSSVNSSPPVTLFANAAFIDCSGVMFTLTESKKQRMSGMFDTIISKSIKKGTLYSLVHFF